MGFVLTVGLVLLALVPVLLYVLTRLTRQPRFRKRPLWSLLFFMVIIVTYVGIIATLPMLFAGELILVAPFAFFASVFLGTPLFVFILRMRAKPSIDLGKLGGNVFAALTVVAWGVCSWWAAEAIVPLLVLLMAMIAWIPLMLAVRREKLILTYHYFVHAVLGGSLFGLLYLGTLYFAGTFQEKNGWVMSGIIAWLVGFLPGVTIGICTAYLTKRLQGEFDKT